MDIDNTKIAVTGGYRYGNGTVFVGNWNNTGLRDGLGHLQFPDNTRYDGYFADGLFNGLGVLTFIDGAKYEGQFLEGWFHGYGIFWRSDGMKHEGEFRGGKIWGLGLTTYSDGTTGFPKNEGFYQDCRMIRKKSCPEVVQRAQKIAFMARNLFKTNCQ
ncbi:MORN repeat [Popillia japonica]|uniref:MORN repeat n=1 Tax=Popillia japonica TaxID=7064 RepID=A0AAW1MVP3_POPJA